MHDGRSANFGFDILARYQYSELPRELKRQLGAEMFHEVVSQSADGNQQILEVSSDIQPPVYYYHDRAKWTLARVLSPSFSSPRAL